MIFLVGIINFCREKWGGLRGVEGVLRVVVIVVVGVWRVGGGLGCSW